ncbi:MAG: 1-acyl-sn-glycerol-3-phosphate acyltransferase [Candidatus Promineifilaceae bacterium]
MTASKLHPFSTRLILRRIAGRLAFIVFPCRHLVKAEHATQVETILEQGNGLIVLMNHFSMRDALQVASWLFRKRVASRRLIVAPVAFHQHTPLVRFLADLIAIKLCPIVTSRTIKLGNGEKRRGTGIREYLNTAVDSLKDGGIVLIAPQGSRKSQLGGPIGHPVGNIISRARRKGVHNFGILCFGLGMPGVASYDRKMVGGSNLFRRFDLRVGQPYDAGEAVELAGGIDLLDAWIFEKLAELVPDVYRGPALKEAKESFSEGGKIVTNEMESCHETISIPQKPG